MAHHYALSLKTRDAQHAGISQQMHLHWEQELGSPLQCILNSSKGKKRLRGITMTAAVRYYSAAKSSPASKTSSSLTFPSLFSMGGWYLNHRRADVVPKFSTSWQFTFTCSLCDLKFISAPRLCHSYKWCWDDLLPSWLCSQGNLRWTFMNLSALSVAASVVAPNSITDVPIFWTAQQPNTVASEYCFQMSSVATLAPGRYQL